MNTKALAREYDKLKPRERLPLIVAASLRGDEAERGRLMRSAPTALCMLPDYHGLAEGVERLALMHLLELLDLATMYWHCSDRLDGAAASRKSAKGGVAKRGTMVRLLGYLFTVKAGAWKQLCGELQIDAEALLQDLPGYSVAQLTAETARLDAFTPEEAAAWVHDNGKDPGRLLNAESELASMRAVLEYRMKWWA
jgi:hypothetical protein